MKNLFIDFYSETEAAIRIQWPSDSPQYSDEARRCFADVLLFSCYALRQLRNLGKHPAAAALASALALWDAEPVLKELSTGGELPSRCQAAATHVMVRTLLPLGIVRDAAYVRYGAPIWLVPYTKQGRRRFVGELGRDESGRLVSKLDVYGFNLIGWDVSLYASDSVLILMAHLVKTYRSLHNFPVKLGEIAAECAATFRAGTPIPLYYEEIALSITNKRLRPSREE